MDKDIIVLLCEVPISWENRLENFANYDKLLLSSYDKSSIAPDIIILPEFFSVGFSMNSYMAEESDPLSLEWLKSASKRFGSAILGSVPVKEGEAYYNRAYFISPEEELYKYDKRHLFSYGGEDSLYTAGRERCIIHYRGWNILLQICYDLRFPVWARNRNLEYDIAINIANWPSVRQSVIEPMIRSRAIENLSYYVFVNRTGSDPSNDYIGGSEVSDFKGYITSPIFDNSGEINGEPFRCKYYRLSLSTLNSFRDKFSAWRDADNFKFC